MKNRLFVISGSSGVGKGTVIKEFLAKHPELNSQFLVQLEEKEMEKFMAKIISF